MHSLLGRFIFKKKNKQTNPSAWQKKKTQQEKKTHAYRLHNKKKKLKLKNGEFSKV